MKAPIAHLALSFVLVSTAAVAADSVSFGTGGYANQLRTPEMMNKIDANKDGMVSRTEWDAWQKKLFAMMDPDHSGTIDSSEFTRAHGKEVVTFATGGFANALRTSDTFAKLDANRDNQVSEDEFVSFHGQLFDRMDTGRKLMLGQNEFFGRGPAR